MPSLSTSFRFLISLGILGLVLHPIFWGYYLKDNWDIYNEIFSTEDKAIHLTYVALIWFSSLCWVKILQYLEFKAQGDILMEKQNQQVEAARRSGVDVV